MTILFPWYGLVIFALEFTALGFFLGLAVASIHRAFARRKDRK